MSAAYLITLAPAGNFFIGGAIGFNDEFYVQSELFPQPTTVVSALRAAMLIGEGLLLQHYKGRWVPKKSWPKASQLVGTASLDKIWDASNPELDLGVIERVSPTFLVQTANDGTLVDAFFPVPSDVVRDREGRMRCLTYRTHPARVHAAGWQQTAVYRSDFNHKEDRRGGCLGGKAFWRRYSGIAGPENELCEGVLNIDEPPFRSQRQVGIGLESQKKTVREGMYYVKNDFKLDPGYAFAVLVWFKGDHSPKLPASMDLGGDRSVFHLKALKDPNATGSLWEDHPILEALMGSRTPLDRVLGASKVALLSPCLPPEGYRKNVVHILVDGVWPLRTLADHRTGAKSQACRMLPVGSVLFIKAGSEWADNYTQALTRIGFNHVMAVAQ